ncbi:hypothetical protein ACWD4B_01535 [Streptomyces sp. NPDC002536]
MTTSAPYLGDIPVSTGPADIPVEDATDDLGEIGARQLLCVQTFDIARHPTAAVGVIPGCFVAVSGKGPQDSNESGKTSWLASVALLLGDPEWRMKGGGPGTVADLLFEPNTAGIAAQHYPAATTGYIAGLFADPDDVKASAHTVWMKLSATAPYVKVRHAPGVHLATAPEESERHTQAADIFRHLPRPSLGAMRYAEELYGPAPRCQAYLGSRGRRRGGPSLLKLDQGLLTPAAIGTALLSLTGREPLMERDVAVRKNLSEAISKRDQQLRQDADKRAREDAQLDAISHRQAAREALTRAWELWQLHYARGLLDALGRQEELESSLRNAEERLALSERAVQQARAEEDALQNPDALKQQRDATSDQRRQAEERLETARTDENECSYRHRRLNEQIHEAEEAARGVHGSLEQARGEADRARADVEQRQGELGAATAAVDAARADLDRAEKGRYGPAGRTISVLRDAKIHAAGLLDSLNLTARERPAWEARLSLYQDAVCIAADDAPAARDALRSLPGAVLIACPAKISGTASKDQVRAFLDELARRMRIDHDPDTAVDQALGLHALGGFTTPLTGRAALVARLRDTLDQTESVLQAAQSGLERTRSECDQANDLVHRLESAALARQLHRENTTVENELAGLRAVTATRRAESEKAQLAYDKANLAYSTLKSQRHIARQHTVQAQRDVSDATGARDAFQNQLTELELAYWIERGGTRESALQQLRWPTSSETGENAVEGAEPEHRTEVTLRRRAGRYLDRSLQALGIDLVAGANAPTPELKDAVVLRANRNDESGSRRFADATAFESPARALNDWLEQLADADEAASRLIQDERAERTDSIAYCRQAVDRLEFDLRAQQDAISLLLDQAMDSIETALTDLNRRAGLYGVELQRVISPPPSLTDLWQCEVTPCWRRTPGGQMLRYDNVTNSAQEKLFAIHLVLAALLASPHPRGRILILDELGDTLGTHHRREVLGALTKSATDHGITVLGTCQESLMDDAADFFGELLYFTYPSLTEALNAPTRMFGYDSNGEHLELTLEALLAGRSWW